MWLDRFSSQSTPSGSPPPQSRSYSPVPRRPSHLGPGAASRPSFSPRSSSLNVAKFNSSSTSLSSPRLPNGSGLKQQVVPPADIADPSKTLEDIVGKPLGRADYDDTNGDVVQKPSEIVEDIKFDDLGLQDFLEGKDDVVEGDSTAQSAEECEYVCSLRSVVALMLT